MVNKIYRAASAIIGARDVPRRPITLQSFGRRILESVMLLLAIGGQLVQPAVAAQAYAAKAQLPTGAGANGMVAAMLRDAVVPERDSVGVPPYPEAQIVQTVQMANPVTGAPTGTVRLISSDPPATVAAWYEQNLTGWRRSEAMGTIAFGEGGREFNPMKPDTWGVVPSVKVEGDDMYDYSAVWSDVQTVIEIAYAVK